MGLSASSPIPSICLQLFCIPDLKTRCEWDICVTDQPEIPVPRLQRIEGEHRVGAAGSQPEHIHITSTIVIIIIIIITFIVSITIIITIILIIVI